MFLLDDILLSPVKLAVWLGEKIQEEAKKQMFDVGAIKGALERLNELHEIGQISDDDFKKVEDKLLKAIERATLYNREKEARGGTWK